MHRKVHEKFMGVCVETNPKLNSNPSNENVRDKNDEALFLFKYVAKVKLGYIDTNTNVHVHTHPARLICLLTTPFYLTDRVLVFGLAPIQSPCTLWRSPQSTNFIPSPSFLPFIYIKERRSCSFTLICLSACYFHSTLCSFGFWASSHLFQLWLLNAITTLT